MGSGLSEELCLWKFWVSRHTERNVIATVQCARSMPPGLHTDRVAGFEFVLVLVSQCLLNDCVKYPQAPSLATCARALCHTTTVNAGASSFLPLQAFM